MLQISPIYSHPPHLFSPHSVCTYPFLRLTFFYLTTGPHAWIYFCFPLPTLHHFHPSPSPITIHGIIEFELHLYEISSPLSQIMTQNSFPVWPVSISLLPRVHKSSFIHKLSYQIFSLATGSNFHRFHPCHPQ